MLSITAVAQEQLSTVLRSKTPSHAAVRVAAVRGPHGCVHGWMLGLVHVAEPEDMVVQAGDVRVLVAPDLIQLLADATLDYREDTTGIGFTIEAPNPELLHQHHHGAGCRHQ